MPSGITANLYEGKPEDRRSFLLRCAKQFGALSHMRDEPLSASIRYPELDTKFHEESIARAKLELERVDSMTLDEVKEMFRIEKEESLRHHQEYEAKKKPIRERYMAMMEDIKKWVPPTPDHEGLKDFAIRQIKESMDFDATERKYEEPYKDVTPEQYIEQRRNRALESILFHEKRLEEEIRLHESRIKWIQEFEKSL